MDREGREMGGFGFLPLLLYVTTQKTEEDDGWHLEVINH